MCGGGSAIVLAAVSRCCFELRENHERHSIRCAPVSPGFKASARTAEKAAVTTVGWRDTDLQLEGPVVGQLQKLFIETWDKQSGQPLAPKAYFPKLQAQGRDVVRAIGSTPDDPYSLIYLTLISAIGNAERQYN